LLIDKAQLLTLTAPEMTAPLGGLRALEGVSVSSDAELSCVLDFVAASTQVRNLDRFYLA